MRSNLDIVLLLSSSGLSHYGLKEHREGDERHDTRNTAYISSFTFMVLFFLQPALQGFLCLESLLAVTRIHFLTNCLQWLFVPGVLTCSYCSWSQRAWRYTPLG